MRLASSLKRHHITNLLICFGLFCALCNACDAKTQDHKDVVAETEQTLAAPTQTNEGNSQLKEQENQPKQGIDMPAQQEADAPPTLVKNTDDMLPNDGETIDQRQADDANSASHRFPSTAYKVLAPLTDSERAILKQITWDEEPEVLNAMKEENENKHFLWSDELHPELFAPSLKDIGGTYIGVGTDQAYLFAGWQRPSLAFFVDYDQWVVSMHLVYMAFFDRCDDAACIAALFSNVQEANDILDAYYESNAQLKQIKTVYRRGRQNIARRLRSFTSMEERNFMNDEDTFRYLQNMIRGGRIVTIQLNLLGDKAFKSIANALNALDAKVMTLYLSNAEQYWSYNKQFKANINILPYHDKAFIMRTTATKPQNGDYRYSIQPLTVFKAWLEHPRGSNVRRVTKAVYVREPDQFPFTVDEFYPQDSKP